MSKFDKLCLAMVIILLPITVALTAAPYWSV